MTLADCQPLMTVYDLRAAARDVLRRRLREAVRVGDVQTVKKLTRLLLRPGPLERKRM
jgi:hypothetical protein